MELLKELLHSKRTSVALLSATMALWVFMFMFASVAVLAILTGCASIPVPKPEVRTETNTVLVPTPVPCIDSRSIPKRPATVKVDPATATTEQLAAALVLDAYHYDLYFLVTDQLLAECAKGEIK